jgi:glutamate dehydrogenase/leucine dehydrogenase
MIGDHHGQTAGRATLLVRAMDGILGTHRTRMAADRSRAEVALLARAMTYKFGVLGLQIGGAKAGLRAPGSGIDRAEYFRRYLEEIRALVRTRTFTTGADLGTDEVDFRPLREAGYRNHGGGECGPVTVRSRAREHPRASPSMQRSLSR